jgi:hypothetical protein
MGNVTLNLNVAATDSRYAQLGAPNTFNASQSILGYLSASGPITSGNSLTVFQTGPRGFSFPVFNVDPLGNLTDNGNATVGGNLIAGGVLSVDSPGVSGGRLIVQSNGNVGIGNPNPVTTLDVAGIIRTAALVSTGPVKIGGDVQMSSAPHMNFSASFPISFCGIGLCGNIGGTGFLYIGGYFIPDRDITIVRVAASMNTPAGCDSPASIDIVRDSQPYIGSSFYGLNVPNGVTNFQSGPLSLNVAAGDGISVILASASCGSSSSTPGQSAGGNGFVNVEYVMQ